MTVAIRSVVAMVHVSNVPRSMEFYRKLGFEVGNTFVPEGQSEPSWAWMESGEASLMLARADEPVPASQQGVLFYLYCEDVAAKRRGLQAKGIPAGPINKPFYSPQGEFRVEDPDGYVLMVTHT